MWSKPSLAYKLFFKWSLFLILKRQRERERKREREGEIIESRWDQSLALIFAKITFSEVSERFEKEVEAIRTFLQLLISTLSTLIEWGSSHPFQSWLECNCGALVFVRKTCSWSRIFASQRRFNCYTSWCASLYNESTGSIVYTMMIHYVFVSFSVIFLQRTNRVNTIKTIMIQ